MFLAIHTNQISRSTLTTMNGCPILASLGWGSTTPNQQALYQGMSLLMPLTAQETRAGFSPCGNKRKERGLVGMGFNPSIYPHQNPPTRFRERKYAAKPRWNPCHNPAYETHADFRRVILNKLHRAYPSVHK